jgi:glutamate 5-kinase
MYMAKAKQENKMKKKRIVVKLGSTTLTGGTNKISRGKLEDLARQINTLMNDYEIVIVTSGAIAAAKHYIELTKGNSIAVKQALAAIGQPVLMRFYQEVFNDYALKIGQCLLTYRDFENENSRSNTLDTINTLIENGYIPVINENDTIATDEIKFGDNDKLGALVAALLKADLLLLASDIDGIYDGDPRKDPQAKLIKEIYDLDSLDYLKEGSSISSLGTGGIASKLEAAKICKTNGVEMWILNGGQEGFAVKAIQGEIDCSKVKV